MYHAYIVFVTGGNNGQQANGRIYNNVLIIIITIMTIATDSGLHKNYTFNSVFRLGRTFTTGPP